jgi:DNA-directed RNA polymerase subunit alpha
MSCLVADEVETPYQEQAYQAFIENLTLDTEVQELWLSVRASNAIMREGFKTVREIYSKTDEELLRIPNFGRKSLAEIRSLIAHAVVK